MEAREAIGRAIGGLLAPFAAIGSLTRGARLFHPDGVVYRAEVQPLADEGLLGELAQRLSGTALVRLSGALFRWRGVDKPDILGIALRFKGNAELTAKAVQGDQDLLLVSSRSLLRLPFGPFTTKAHDFLANTYYAILPFHVDGLGQVKWRLSTSGVKTTGRNRHERLDQSVCLGIARLHLEVRPAKGGAPWTPVVGIDLREQIQVDQEKLAFNPFRSGLGIHPIGLFQSTRAAVYAASQAGRRAARKLR